MIQSPLGNHWNVPSCDGKGLLRQSSAGPGFPAWRPRRPPGSTGLLDTTPIASLPLWNSPHCLRQEIISLLHHFRNIQTNLNKQGLENENGKAVQREFLWNYLRLLLLTWSQLNGDVSRSHLWAAQCHVYLHFNSRVLNKLLFTAFKHKLSSRITPLANVRSIQKALEQQITQIQYRSEAGNVLPMVKTTSSFFFHWQYSTGLQECVFTVTHCLMSVMWLNWPLIGRTVKSALTLKTDQRSVFGLM